MSTPSPVVAAAATAVPIDAAHERQAWFQVLCDTYQAAPDTSWNEFVENLSSAAEQAGVSPAVVTEFVRVMDESPAPLQVVAEMHQAGVEILEFTYESAETQPQVETDPQVWLATLHELGARWDRDEANWPVFREWFRHETEQRGLGAEGRMFVEYVEAGDKVQVFDEYQIPVPAPAEDQPQEKAVDFPVIAEGDTGDWVAYADELLTRAGY